MLYDSFCRCRPRTPFFYSVAVCVYIELFTLLLRLGMRPMKIYCTGEFGRSAVVSLQAFITYAGTWGGIHDLS
ncbi:hypothetical protein BDV28DRAFT_141087 [Aspergillus coremiiformis]|uniref:Uncharacterized protein n=1 Tax=Aspergillus coremiiformis TaxID=138285 RepID=A0A5N6YXW3_9EURO|nr:hypothetical protein BDV28DRAFT_141087 [Aspergillus coremiiformis]